MARKKSSTTKSKRSKQELSNRKKLIYAVVVNTWGDTELAKNARGWSDKTLKERLGIVLPKSKPKRVSSKETRKKYQEQYELFQTVIEQNEELNPVDIKKEVKTKPKSTITLKYFRKRDISQRILDKTDRINQWVKWSKEKKYPKEIELLAEAYNKKRAKKLGISYRELEANDDLHAGWIIVYQAYINNESAETWFEKLSFNRWNSNIYAVEKSI